MPGWQAVVTRPERVRLWGQDETGWELSDEFAGWPARIVQHETDHLNGMLRSLSTNDHVAELWNQPRPFAAATALGFSLPRGEPLR